MKTIIIALVLALLPAVRCANGGEQGASGPAICAERELLLATLVEAHGEIPNAASARLTEAGGAIMQARAACGDGRVNEAVALYDRLIAELESVLTHRGE
jgi:hypothetical protein